jgi:hypothetical protein
MIKSPVYLKLHFHLLQTKQTKTLTTGFTDPPAGHVTFRRIEWGIGKGGYKREVNRLAYCLGMTGKLRARYFLIGSCYRGEFTGTTQAANKLYEAA